MIRIKLIPDGITELPVEAKDHGILKEKLKEADVSDADDAPSWREIKRTTHRTRLFLEIPGPLDEYDEDVLNEYAESVGEINGLKKHPEGWVEEAGPEKEE